MVNYPAPRIPPIPLEWRQFVPDAILGAHDDAARGYEAEIANDGHAVIALGGDRSLTVPVIATGQSPPGGKDRLRDAYDRALRTIEAVARVLTERLGSEELTAFGREDLHTGELKRINAAAFRETINIVQRGRCFAAQINFMERSVSFALRGRYDPANRMPTNLVFYDLRLGRPDEAAAALPRARRATAGDQLHTATRRYHAGGNDLTNRKQAYRAVLDSCGKTGRERGWSYKTFCKVAQKVEQEANR